MIGLLPAIQLMVSTPTGTEVLDLDRKPGSLHGADLHQPAAQHLLGETALHDATGGGVPPAMASKPLMLTRDNCEAVGKALEPTPTNGKRKSSWDKSVLAEPKP